MLVMLDSHVLTCSGGSKVFNTLTVNITIKPPLLSAEHHSLVLDMKIIMQFIEILLSLSVKGSKLIVKIQKGRMLAELVKL